MQAVVKLKAAESLDKTPLDKRPDARYAGELVWTEPFVTVAKQTLRLELDVHKHDGRICHPLRFTAEARCEGLEAVAQDSRWREVR